MFHSLSDKQLRSKAIKPTCLSIQSSNLCIYNIYYSIPTYLNNPFIARHKHIGSKTITPTCLYLSNHPLLYSFLIYFNFSLTLMFHLLPDLHISGQRPLNLLYNLSNHATNVCIQSSHLSNLLLNPHLP